MAKTGLGSLQNQSRIQLSRRRVLSAGNSREGISEEILRGINEQYNFPDGVTPHNPFTRGSLYRSHVPTRPVDYSK